MDNVEYTKSKEIYHVDHSLYQRRKNSQNSLSQGALDSPFDLYINWELIVPLTPRLAGGTSTFELLLKTEGFLK